CPSDFRRSETRSKPRAQNASREFSCFSPSLRAKRSNPEAAKEALDCFGARAPRNDESHRLSLRVDRFQPRQRNETAARIERRRDQRILEQDAVDPPAYLAGDEDRTMLRAHQRRHVGHDTCARDLQALRTTENQLFHGTTPVRWLP